MLLWHAALVALSACVALAHETPSCITEYNPDQDYFPHKISVDEADLFSVVYMGHYKIVRNEATDETYVLYLCGTPKPSVSSSAPVKYFQIPLSRIANAETVTLTFLEILGVRDTITRMDASWVTSPCAQRAFQSGDIQPFDPADAAQVAEVDAVFDSVYGRAEPKFIASGTVSRDPGMLQRAEWIEFFSLFYNLEERANDHFAAVQARYECHATAMRQMWPKPTLMWMSVSGGATNRSWVIESSASVVQLVRDAGALYSPPATTVITDAAVLAKILAATDVLIDSTYGVRDYAELLAAYGLSGKERYPCLEQQRVWRNDKRQNARGGNDWWESAYAEPDVLLEDVIYTVHPSYQRHETVWLRNVATGERPVVLTAAACADPAAPYNVLADLCPNAPSPAPVAKAGNEAPLALIGVGLFIAGVVVTVLAVFGLSTWRRRTRDSSGTYSALSLGELDGLTSESS